MTDTASPRMTVADLRRQRGESLEEFAATLGLKSKGSASEIESYGRCSLRVALTIEELSDGRIDAAWLNPDVAAARGGKAAA